jgi:hypothetical protein
MVQSSNCILKPDFQTSGGHDKSFKMYHFYIMIFMSLPLLGGTLFSFYPSVTKHCTCNSSWYFKLEFLKTLYMQLLLYFKLEFLKTLYMQLLLYFKLEFLKTLYMQLLYFKLEFLKTLHLWFDHQFGQTLYILIHHFICSSPPSHCHQ